MSSPLPLQRPIDHTPHSESAIQLTDDDSSRILESLASENAREILAVLADDPDTASSVAEKVDTSLQNVDYHINNLLDAGLISEVGTWYSAKGKEMTVYGVTSERLELQFSAGSPPSQQSGQSKPISSPTPSVFNDD